MADESELKQRIRRIVNYSKQMAIYTALQQQCIMIENEPYPISSDRFRHFIVETLKMESQTAFDEMSRLGREEPLPFGNPQFILGMSVLPVGSTPTIISYAEARRTPGVFSTL
jgi:hypothetical protein